MLDSVSAVAFEMQAGKGMFALLLGSGVSRSAKIPTGWDITLDMIKRVAAARGEDPGDDLVNWYTKNFNKAPDYSDLLDVLASTPTLRQQVIRPYIEPSEEERGRGEKLPTTAHIAIAKLMAKGYVRVVLTTNFDSLLEQALGELGVRPTVIASADHAVGALPLVHSGPIIVKLHGDYLDTRIRNTLEELSSYEPSIDNLLDRILDEFGLIACGWSGEWDVALKAAIDRAPSRRFPMYWAARGKPSPSAQALIDRRGGRVVQIAGADEFFDTLEQRVQAIEVLRAPHPLSTDIAVAMLKEYLPEERHRIRLNDLLGGQFIQTAKRLDELQFSTSVWSQEEFIRQTNHYVSSTESMLALAFTAGMWSNDQQIRGWSKFLVELGSRKNGVAGMTPLANLRALPAVLIFYALCLGGIATRNFSVVGQVISTSIELGGKFRPLGVALNIATAIPGPNSFNLLPAYANKSYPGSEMVADILRPIAKNELRDIDAFDDVFARLEIALSFKYVEEFWGGKPGNYAPLGYFLFNYRLRSSILDSWRADYDARQTESDLSLMANLKELPMFDAMISLWDSAY